MTVTETIPQMEDFKVTGLLDGKTSIYPGFYYQLIPPLTDSFYYFKVVINHSVTGDVSGRLDFKGSCTFKIESSSIPDSKFLYGLVHDANLEILKLLAGKILREADFEPMYIPAPSFDQAKVALQVTIDNVIQTLN